MLSRFGRWWRVAIGVAVLLTAYEFAVGGNDAVAPPALVETPGFMPDAPALMPNVDMVPPAPLP